MAKFSITSELYKAIKNVNKSLAQTPNADLAKALQELLALYESKKNLPTIKDMEWVRNKIEGLEKRMSSFEEMMKKHRDNTDKRFIMRSMLGAR